MDFDAVLSAPKMIPPQKISNKLTEVLDKK